MKMESMSESEMFDLVDTKVSDNRSLVVVDDLSTKQDWDCIKHYFPDNKNGSRVIVSTQHQEIASFCVEKQHQVSRLKQFASDQCLCLFHKKILDRALHPKHTSNDWSTDSGAVQARRGDPVRCPLTFSSAAADVRFRHVQEEEKQ